MAVLEFGDIAEFAVDFEAREVRVHARSPLCTEDDLAHFLFDHVAPRLLARLGHLILHGAALAREGRLVGLIGNTGAGKSTLAASLAEAGFTLIGDDSIVTTQIDGRFCGTSLYRSLRLYRDSIDAVFGNGRETSAMSHYSDKRRLDRDRMVAPPPDPLPLAALFYLAEDFVAEQPFAKRLGPAQLCMRCTEQSFALMPTDPEETRQRFTTLAALASCVPGYELHYSRSFGDLPAVHRLIAETIERAPCAVALNDSRL